MPNTPSSVERTTRWALVMLAWLVVSLPLLWGVWETVKKAAVLFR